MGLQTASRPVLRQALYIYLSFFWFFCFFFFFQYFFIFFFFFFFQIYYLFFGFGVTWGFSFPVTRRSVLAGWLPARPAPSLVHRMAMGLQTASRPAGAATSLVYIWAHFFSSRAWLQPPARDDPSLLGLSRAGLAGCRPARRQAWYGWPSEVSRRDGVGGGGGGGEDPPLQLLAPPPPPPESKKKNKKNMHFIFCKLKKKKKK